MYGVLVLACCVLYQGVVLYVLSKAFLGSFTYNTQSGGLRIRF